MDVGLLSMAVSQSSLNSDLGIAVLSKNLDTMKDSGDGMIKMMEASVTPYLGQNIDYSV